jgi:hypothetical protein
MKDGSSDHRLPQPPMPDLNLKPATSLAAAPLAEVTDKMQSRWNTQNLGLRLAVDATSATTAAALIAPVISIIDR